MICYSCHRKLIEWVISFGIRESIKCNIWELMLWIRTGLVKMCHSCRVLLGIAIDILKPKYFSFVKWVLQKWVFLKRLKEALVKHFKQCLTLKEALLQLLATIIIQYKHTVFTRFFFTLVRWTLEPPRLRWLLCLHCCERNETSKGNWIKLSRATLEILRLNMKHLEVLNLGKMIHL